MRPVTSIHRPRGCRDVVLLQREPTAVGWISSFVERPMRREFGAQRLGSDVPH